MADGKTHKKVGEYSGAGLALLRAATAHQPLPAVVAETVGGYYGGRHGARFHDVVEPATSPRHRDFFHGVAFNTAVASLGKKKLDSFQDALRTRATELVERALDDNATFLDALVYLLGAAGLHFAVGYTNGLVGGAASHLVLDVGTPDGLPLLVRGL